MTKPLSERVAKALAFDEDAVHERAHKLTKSAECASFYFAGREVEATRRKALDAAYVKCVEALEGYANAYPEDSEAGVALTSVREAVEGKE